MTIEELTIAYLTAANLPGIGGHVYAETPVDPPNEYVLIQRTGGGSADYIRQHTIITETISRTDKLTAATLHEEVVEAMLRMADTADVYRCRLNSDYDATRADRKEYKYQALWEITVY